MVGVKPHVLRYWETQFKRLRPKKGRGGARMYRKREVETLSSEQLLYDQRSRLPAHEGSSWMTAAAVNRSSSPLHERIARRCSVP